LNGKSGGNSNTNRVYQSPKPRSPITPMEQNYFQNDKKPGNAKPSGDRRRSIPNSPPLQVQNVEADVRDNSSNQMVESTKIIYPDLLNINQINMKRRESGQDGYI